MRSPESVRYSNGRESAGSLTEKQFTLVTEGIGRVYKQQVGGHFVNSEAKG